MAVSCGCCAQQTGPTPMNITLLGNAIWGDNSSALDLELDGGSKSRLSIVGCLLEDYGTAATALHQTKFLTDVATPSTESTLADHLDDFRTLGVMDLAWNYPQLYS